MNRAHILGTLGILTAIALLVSFVGHFGSPNAPAPGTKSVLHTLNDLSLSASLETGLLAVATIALALVGLRTSQRTSAGYWWALAGTFAILSAVKASEAFEALIVQLQPSGRRYDLASR